MSSKENAQDLGELDALEIQPLSLLIEELKSNDAKMRAKSVSQIHLIALALTPDRVRAILIPFLYQLFDGEEDEVLSSLIEAIPNLLSFIGGPSYSHLLLDLLFTQITKFDEKVCEVILQSLKKIFAKIDIKKNEKLIINALNSLAEPGVQKIYIKDLSL